MLCFSRFIGSLRWLKMSLVRILRFAAVVPAPFKDFSFIFCHRCRAQMYAPYSTAFAHSSGRLSLNSNFYSLSPRIRSRWSPRPFLPIVVAFWIIRRGFFSISKHQHKKKSEKYGWEKRKGNSSSFSAAHSYLVVMCERHFNISKSYFRHNSQTVNKKLKIKKLALRRRDGVDYGVSEKSKMKCKMMKKFKTFGMSQQVSYFARIFRDSFLKNINILLMQHKLLANKKSKWFSRGVENNINRMMENIFLGSQKSHSILW